MTGKTEITPDFEAENLITKFTQILERKDGSEVKIVATAFFGSGLHRSVGVDVFTRQNPEQQWHLCSDKAHPRWRDMSVDEYIKNGRSEKFQAASHGEILKAASMIGKPICSESDVDSCESPKLTRMRP